MRRPTNVPVPSFHVRDAGHCALDEGIWEGIPLPARATPRCSRAPSLGLRTWGVPSTTWLKQARGTHTIAVPAPRLPTAPAPPLVGRAPSSASLAHPTRRGSVILGRRSFGPTQRRLSDTSETLQRHFRDASETLQRRFGDASETLQRHFRDTQRHFSHFRDALKTLQRHSETLQRHFRDTSETLQRHLRDTSDTVEGSGAQPPPRSPALPGAGP